MVKRTYITVDELNILLKYLKDNKLYHYYLIILCLTELNINYKELSKFTWAKLYIALAKKPKVLAEIDEIRDIVNSKEPITLHIRSFNKTIKIIQRRCKLHHIKNFSTKLFSSKLNLDGDYVYGYVEYRNNRKLLSKEKENYIYVLEQTHRDKSIGNLLTDKKIGITHSLSNRIISLTLGPVGVKCIGLWKADNRLISKIEKTLHKKFKDRNIVGEWFEDSNNDLIHLVRKEIKTFNLLDMEIKEMDVI